VSRWDQITDVVVEDAGRDVIAVEDEGEGTVLLIRPGQTHDSAARTITKLFPYATPDEVSALVRRHLPDAPRLDDLTRLQVAPAGSYGYDMAAGLTLLKVPVMVGLAMVFAIFGAFWLMHQDPDERFDTHPIGATDRQPAGVSGSTLYHDGLHRMTQLREAPGK